MIKRVKPGSGVDLSPALDGRMQNLIDLDEETRAMACGSYGYGSWHAPYWFIGPEQGMGPHENGDIKSRIHCWRQHGSLELNDCRDFHRCIREVRWHFKEPRVKLQGTWRPLLLLLMTFLGRPADKESLRSYQRDRWGALDGETCVIELSGLAAPNMMEAQDTTPFLRQRIEAIRNRIRDHRPKLVVMYGKEKKPSWEQIAEREFPCEPTPFFCKGPTLLAMAPHPVWPIKVGGKYVVNEYWIGLGQKLRDHRCKST